MIFDFQQPAELFAAKSQRRGGGMSYRRFATAAEAVRFAVEELPAPFLAGTYIETAAERLGAEEIKQLYQSAEYPLPRDA